MTANLAPILFATLSVLLGAFFVPRAAFDGLGLRALVPWLLALPLFVVFNNPLVPLLLLFVALVFLAPLKPSRRIMFFMMVVPAAPLYLQAQLPFPGINYLLVLDYYKVAVLALLVPLIVIPRPADTPAQRWSVWDFCIIAYILYTSAQVGFGTNLIGGLRFFLDQSLKIGVPYFALTRIATTSENTESCLRGVLVAGILLAAISLVATFKQWDFYRFAHFDPISAFADIRGGFLRVQATLTTHSLGFHLAACALLLEFFKGRLPLGWIQLWILRGMLLAGTFFTGSRGAMVGIVVAYVVHRVVSIQNAALRWSSMAAVGVFSAIAAYVLMFGNASEYDTYGSFDYRQQLLTASFRFLSDNLLFGDVNFLESGRFDHLIQGQGIIDVTNMYLQVALSHGLVGVMLFFMPFLATLLRLGVLAMSPEARRARVNNQPGLHSLLCGILVGWLVLVATTSDVGLTLHLGLVFLALGHAVVLKSLSQQLLAPGPVTASWELPSQKGA